MKVLWVKSGGFLPLDAGGKIRSFSIARELSRHHDVSIFTFYPATTPDPHRKLYDHFQQIECFPIDVPERASLHDVMAYAANSFTSRPYQMFKYCRPEVTRRLREVLSKDRYDVVVCDYLLTAGVLPWDLHIPTIMFTHNVEAVVWKRHCILNRNPLWKLVAFREHRAVARFERHFGNLADHVLAVSDVDRNEFLNFLPPDKVSAIPTGVDLDYFRPQQTLSRNHSLVFTGSMDWKPNEDAVCYFAATILPLILKRVPDVVFQVVGKKPTRKILALKEKNPAIQVRGRLTIFAPTFMILRSTLFLCASAAVRGLRYSRQWRWDYLWFQRV